MNEETIETLVNRAKSIFIGVATGVSSYSDLGLQNEYEQIRARLISDPKTKALLPKFVLFCRLLSEFWAFIRPKFSTYSERRAYLADEFDPLLTAIENNFGSQPADSAIIDTLKNLDSNEVNTIWQKAMDRREQDPEGALTMARTLLETVIKHILDDLTEDYKEDDELSKLYKRMASRLDLAPSQQTEQIFKQLLSGCHNVVEGIGAMRNKLSDAHGKGRSTIELSDRHVELGVNMAGVLATFWVKTFKRSQKDPA